GVGQARDRAQRHLFAAAGDHHRRTRFLYGLRLEDRLLDVEIPAVEGRAWLGPHLENELDRFLHLPDAGCRLRRELPAVLLVFILEKAGTDAERQPSPADQIDARRDLGEMRGIAITDRRAKGGDTDTTGDGGQPRQNGPAFQDRLVGRAHAGDLDHVIHDREPDKAVSFCPLRLRLHRLECLGRIGTVKPRRVVNAEPHYSSLIRALRSGPMGFLVSHWRSDATSFGRYVRTAPSSTASSSKAAAISARV